jgi:para-nitrobenzyl esterase
MNEPIPDQSEDCLFLNVWTPGTSGKLPVFFWLHGGMTRNGHGVAPAVNGAALARQQNLVVVTINYRLGALGGLAHPDLVDESTGYCANWGLQDKIAALNWVQQSISAFGGDPANVTLAGQSSGAANTAIIAQNDLAPGCFHKIITQSPPLFRPPMFVELDAAAEYTELLAQKLDIPVAKLREVDGVDLQRNEHALAYSPETTAKIGRPRTAPVRDGKLIRQWPYDAPSVNLPVLAGWTRDEANFWFDLVDGDGKVISPQKSPQTPEELEKRVNGLMGLHYNFPSRPDARSIADAYLFGNDVPAAWSQLYTDLAFRAPILHFAGRQAKAGHPTYVYEFAYPLPAPGKGSPHASDVAFVFGTTGTPHLACKIGNAPAVSDVSKAMMGAWADFARTGSPSGTVDWPVFDPAKPRVMQFGPDQSNSVDLRSSDKIGLWPAYGA